MPIFLRGSQKEQGFTMIEVVVVVSVMATVLTLSTILFYEGIRYVETSKIRNQAISMAEEKIENIRNTSFENIPTSNPNPLSDTKNIGNTTFTRNVAATASPAEITGATNDIKKITVTVSWSDTSGSKSVRLVTFRSRNL